MHKFICNTVGGKIVPQRTSKRLFFQKLLDSYESLNKSYMVTIEIIEKDINEQQVGLYNAFISKASQHFGNTFTEMQNILSVFHPLMIDTFGHKPISSWSTKELSDFLEQASSLLSEQGFKFE
jgi:hypothetical protein